MVDEHGGRRREWARARGASPGELLDFSANVNFLGPTLPVIAAARQSLEEMSWYPQDPPAELMQAVASYLRVSENRVLVGNGASELISLVVAALRPRRVVVAEPTFTEYARTARAWGAEVDRIGLTEETDFGLTLDRVDDPGFRDRMEQADLLCLCDPNNPTGALLDREVRRELIRLAEETSTWMLVDESFLGFTKEWPAGSAAELESSRVIVVHSLTKILALPGLRVGAAVVPPPLADPLRGRIPPWNINCVAQAAATAALEDADMLARTPAETGRRRLALVERLAGLGFIDRVFPAEANFLLLKLADGSGDAGRLADTMLCDHGILIRDLTRFPGMGPRYFRVAVRGEDENGRLLSALEQAGALIGAGDSPAAGREGGEVRPQAGTGARTGTGGVS